MTKHKEVFLSINGLQSVRLEKRKVEFKFFLNKYQFYLKCMLILSVIETMLKVMRVPTQKTSIFFIPCSFTYKFICVNDKFSKPIVLYRGKNAAYKFIEAIKEYEYS